MTQNFKNRQKFLELKKKYGFDIAVLKKNPDHKEIDEDELYQSLLVFDTQNKIVDILNEYANDVNFSTQELASIVTVLMNAAGEIVSNIAGQDPDYVLLFKEIALEKFNSHLKDDSDGK